MRALGAGTAARRVASRFARASAIGLLVSSAVLLVGGRTAFAHTPHDDIFDVATSPNYDNDGTVFVVSRGVLLKSTDRGTSWQRLVRGLDTEQDLVAVEASRQSPHVLFAASSSRGVYRSLDGGASWSSVARGIPRAIVDLALSPRGDDVVYAAGGASGLFRTVDGGATWTAVEGFDRPVRAIEFAPDEPQTVFVGDDGGTVSVTRDGGNTWTRHAISGYGRIRALGPSPRTTGRERIFIGTDRGLLVSEDGGDSYQRAGDDLPERSISSIVLSPNYAEDTTLWTTVGDKGLFESSDGGRNWSPRISGLTTNPQVLEPGYMNRVAFGRLHLAGTAVRSEHRTFFLEGFDGLFRSNDEGRSWKQLETLSSSIVVGLAISPDYANDGTIAVTTYINGAFLSEDRGTTWRAINNGLEQLTVSRAGF